MFSYNRWSKCGVNVLKEISSINSALRIFAPRTGASLLVQKPKIISVFPENIGNLKYVSDTFQSTKYKPITPEEVKGLFVDGKINGGELRKKMYTIKMILFLQSFLSIKKFKLWLHSVDLSSKLTKQDCELVAHYMNLFDGKYSNIWKEYSSTDNIPNIEKLALFIRSIKRIKKTDFYSNLDEITWEVCIDGIIKRPREVILPMLEYKFDSTEINEALTNKRAKSQIWDKIEKIKNFLDKQFLKHDTTVYRGEGGFGVFNSVKLENDKYETLKPKLEDFTERIKSGLCSQEEIDNFIKKNLLKQYVTQERFMSTAIEPSAIESYAREIYWEIFLPAKSKASMIEAYNVERKSEAEILVQKMSKLSIKEARYDHANQRWYIKAKLEQEHLA